MRSCYLCVGNKFENTPQDGCQSQKPLQKFPIEPNMRAMWIAACNLNEKTDDISKLYICSRHFNPEDFVRSKYGGTVTLKLKPRVVPTQLLPGPKKVGIDMKDFIDGECYDAEGRMLSKLNRKDASTMTENISCKVIDDIFLKEAKYESVKIPLAKVTKINKAARQKSVHETRKNTGKTGGNQQRLTNSGKTTKNEKLKLLKKETDNVSSTIKLLQEVLLRLED